MCNVARVMIHGSLLEEFYEGVSLLVIAPLYSQVERGLAGSIRQEWHNEALLLRELTDEIDTFETKVELGKEMHDSVTLRGGPKDILILGEDIMDKSLEMIV